DLGCPGVVAVVSAGALRIRAGTMQVAEDVAWQECMEFLRGHVREMLHGVNAYLDLLASTDPDLVRYVRRELPVPREN
ncbi:MAG: hypothetical protein AB1758_03705, partial [Candidatus Eremiobacterota bacterium]